MDKNNKKVFFAQNLSDALYQLDTTKDISVLAGCTQADMSNSFTTVPMPTNSLIIRNIADLQIIDRHERYIDFGAAVTFSQMMTMTQNKLPAFVYDAASSIAINHVRNIATIGGNICCPTRKMILYSPLLALDAKLEIKNSQETVIIPITKFNKVPEKSLLTRIRLPLEEWQISIFKRIGPAKKITASSASFTFLANSQKGILTDLRIAFCGEISLRNRELENRLIGSRLPLNQKQIISMISFASDAYNIADALAHTSPDISIPTDEILKDQFLNLLFHSLEQLA